LDLLSSIPTINIARWGRAARLARLLRVLRGVRATKILGALALARRAESAFLAVALVAILLLVAASISILQVETVDGSNIKTADDALWWALTTITTVGYGDRYPVTPEGRFIAGVLMCAGVGLFGMFSGLLAAWFVAPEAKEGRGELELLKDEVRQLRALLENTVGQNQPQ
jgi:voltage-gated potassium channel